MNGADVKVYERDSNRYARDQGATLDLHDESGLKALRKAGLIDAFEANYRPGAEKLRVTDKSATIIFDEHARNNDEISRPEIDRVSLKNILLDSVYPDSIIWNSHLASLSPQGDSWKLEFKEGHSAFADIVIAADGANSKIRSYITPIKPFYSGITIVEGIVNHSETASPQMYRLLRGGKIFALDNEQSLIISSKGDGSIIFYTGCKTFEHWNRESGINFSDKAQVLEWFKREFTGWDAVWQELFENATSPFVPRPQYYMPLDQIWESLPNLTMLGDAAHLMPPYAGEGVNMAMLDALELSECFNDEKFHDIKSSIEFYEKQMRFRAAEAAKQTMESTNALHSPNAISYLMQVIG